MENRSHALIAGFFTIALLILAIFIAIWLGRDKIQRTPYEIVTKSAVSGLNLQAAVRYKGIKVGNVTDIDFDDKNPGQLILRLEVIPDTPVTSATFATLAYQGVTGIAFVQLDEDKTAGASVPLAQDGTTQRIPLRPGVMQNLEERGLAILTQTEELTRRINSLLDPKNRQTMISAVDNINKAAEAWQALPNKLNPTLDKLPGLIDQTQNTLNTVSVLSKDASRFTNNLNQLSTQLQAADGPIARFNLALDQLSNGVTMETLPRIQSLTGEARSSLRSLNRTTENLNDRPQSILFGNPPATPGPGEAGFVAPK
ncbi:MCE family protein [Undibacterium sp. 14-3-2]|uniref:MlaD family protein n=1 Tax=Undibacterium sp. 14-3-2 TaxID=2800129 RepID=UPI0019077ACB|nr:MlaD family protein [Undibacterium sp. 14-3-2]MBK1888898.1 MCE family protein [Undibacterium sp. 14-3-2]